MTIKRMDLCIYSCTIYVSELMYFISDFFVRFVLSYVFDGLWSSVGLLYSSVHSVYYEVGAFIKAFRRFGFFVLTT